MESSANTITLNIHQDIIEKLLQFHKMHKIPNILFNGMSGCGKSKIVKDFMDLIYQDIIVDKNKDDYIMWVNCAHGKGIKFVRDELKFFAKTHINTYNGNVFKSVILLNGDKLTSDAQSALRRCIELYNHTTRFFMTVEDKYQLIKPILSRFSEMYIPEPEINGELINIYKYNIDETFKLTNVYTKRITSLKNTIQKTLSPDISENDLIQFIVKLYNSAYSSLDIIYLLEKNFFKELVPETKKYELLIFIENIKKEFRDERWLMMYIFYFIYFDKEIKLDKKIFII